MHVQKLSQQRAYIFYLSKSEPLLLYDEAYCVRFW